MEHLIPFGDFHMIAVHEPSWQEKLSNEFNKPYFIELLKKIDKDISEGKLILPMPVKLMTYKALEMTPLYNVKVVILGQDPYPNIKNAMGMAFSSPGYLDIPPSLKNMFKELKNDLKIDNKSADLSYWAAQGVLLLNTILTTIRDEPGSHSGYGWETFTDEVIKTVCKRNSYVIYWLLGNNAQKKEKLIIENSKDKMYNIIKLPHPSPQSAHTGFFWSKPYSKTNKLLTKHNLNPIDWRT